MTKKICAALKFAADASDATILNACLVEWAKRNISGDGSLKPNSYAPIYLVRGDIKESVRRIGTDLALFVEKARCSLPVATTTYVMPTPLEEPKPKAKKKAPRRKAKK